MVWNWQQKNWPVFEYITASITEGEKEFLHKTGIIFGASKHLSNPDQQNLLITLVSDEALNTSEIEGEYLNRDSLQSSIRRHFGISTDNRKITPAEFGISEMMINLYDTYNKPLTHETLLQWHRMLTNGRRDLRNIGEYRTCKDPMQVVSGKYHDPIVHFEAPPSSVIKKEMERYIYWFNNNTANTHQPLTKAAIAHIYFESIHPFEDGNGRIGRALILKSLSQSLNQQIILALSSIINKKKKYYYNALEQNNKGMEITKWLTYFSNTILEAQEYSLNIIEFLIKKTKFYDRYKNLLNSRQEKVINRIFAEGLDGFKGGMSADKYISITKTSKATATRDLVYLSNLGAFNKTGVLKGSRYFLKLD